MRRIRIGNFSIDYLIRMARCRTYCQSPIRCNKAETFTANKWIIIDRFLWKFIKRSYWTQPPASHILWPVIQTKLLSVHLCALTMQSPFVSMCDVRSEIFHPFSLYPLHVFDQINQMMDCRCVYKEFPFNVRMLLCCVCVFFLLFFHRQLMHAHYLHFHDSAYKTDCECNIYIHIYLFQWNGAGKWMFFAINEWEWISQLSTIHRRTKDNANEWCPKAIHFHFHHCSIHCSRHRL